MHVSLYVSDLAQTVNFYTSFFGRPADKVKPAYAKYILDEPALIISFVENRERVAANFGHLGFQVATEEALEQRLADAKTKRMEVREEMGTNCCYATQDKFWVNDPDGHQWEVYFFHQDAEFNDPHYQVEDASACCMPPADVAATPVEKQKIALGDLQNSDACTPGGNCC